jgi:hypothetical protein
MFPLPENCIMQGTAQFRRQNELSPKAGGPHVEFEK